MVSHPLLSNDYVKTLAAFAVVLICATKPSLAEDAPCVTAKIVAGSQCPNPKVEIDLSKCDDKLTASPTANCSNGNVKVTAASKKFVYSISFSESEAWGKKSYSLDSATRAAVADKGEAKKDSPKIEKPKLVEIPKVPQPLADSGVIFGGVFDAYYGFNFNRPKSVPSPSVALPLGNTGFRYYDQYHNQFALNLAELSVKKTSGPVQFAVDFDFGEMADANAAVGTAGTNSAVDEVSKHIGQATLTYSPESLDGVAITVGKMYTHLGYEVAKAKDNWQYSRSYTYGFGMPVWHTGIAITFPMVKDVLSAGLFLYNGWNNLYDNNDGKTYGLQFKLTPVDKFAITYNLITGPEQAEENGNFRTVNELNLLVNFSSKVQGVVEGLFGFEPEGNAGKTTKWFGVSVHARAQITDWLWMSPRFEFFRQNDGTAAGADTFGTEDQNIISGTWTNGFVIGNGLEARLELRYDGSKNERLFVTNDGTKSKHQFTTAIAGMYSF